MLLAGSSTAQVYLGLRKAGVWVQTKERAEAEPVWLDAESALEAWQRALVLVHATKVKPRIHVWLSGGLCRPFIFQPVPGLRRSSEALQVAAGMAPDATGLPGPCSVLLDAWQVDKPCVAVAMERAVRDGIEAQATASRVRLTALRPWWTEALNAALDDSANAPRLLAAEEEDALTILSGEAGKFSAATSYVPRPDTEQSQALLARARMAADVPSADARRAWIAGAEHGPPFAARVEALP